MVHLIIIQEKLDSGEITLKNIIGFTDLNYRLQECNLILEYGQTITDIFIRYLNKLKSEGNTVAKSTNKNFKTTFESLNASLQSLTSNASLLSSINKEISETGRIGEV